MPRRPELLKLDIPRPTVVMLVSRLRQHAREQTSDLRTKLFSAADKLEGWLSQDGDTVRCEAPLANWHWLAQHCLRFPCGGFGGSLARQLDLIETAGERRREAEERKRRDASLARDAERLRREESLA